MLYAVRIYGLCQVKEVKNILCNHTTLVVPALNGFYGLILDVFILILRVVPKRESLAVKVQGMCHTTRC